MKFEVTAIKWGNYKKGDVLDMHPTTGNACSKFVTPFIKDKKAKKESK